MLGFDQIKRIIIGPKKEATTIKIHTSTLHSMQGRANLKTKLKISPPSSLIAQSEHTFKRNIEKGDK